MTLGERIIDEYGEYASDVLLADGFEDAFMGIAEIHSLPPRACYDREKCIKILFDQFVESAKQENDRTPSDDRINDIWDEAVEYFEFNVSGAYVGEATPTFLTVLPSTDA
jgi:hypothetical protein|tara:strand:+ start:70 stop:399 length:330 start_codon:yes stop_codon:yes gene_type:complete